MNELHKEQRELLRSLVTVNLISSVDEGIAVPSSTQGPTETASTASPNTHSNNARVVSACIAAGYYPQIAKCIRPPMKFIETIGGALEREVDVKEIKMYVPVSSLNTEEGDTLTERPGAIGCYNSCEHYDISTDGMRRAFIHPSSVNFSNSTYKYSSYITFSESQRVVTNMKDAENTTKIYLRETSEVCVYALLLFGGRLQANYAAGIISVDNWIRYFNSPLIFSCI
jgi:ATP-dependent RNA helicase DHX57